jgi:hypothetical protein
MDDNTINAVDKNWTNLFSVDLIHSPSLRFKKMIKNSGAAAAL